MTAILTQTHVGPMLVPPYDIYLSQAMIRRGAYAPAEFATWAPYIPRGGVVLDVGANFGAHTFVFADAVGPSGAVFAIEPQRQLYYMLCGTAALTGRPNVFAKHCALGATAGIVKIPAIDYGAVENFGALELDDTEDDAGEPVPRVTLDSLGLQRLDFLKIDVEGMELDVLSGSEQTIGRCRPVISAEADREHQINGLIAWLKAKNYRLWWHRPPLGDLWPNIVSVNLLALPAEHELPEPTGDVEAI